METYFETSPSIAEITKALVAFHSEVEAVKKDGKNPAFKSRYPTLNAILSEVRPLLTKNGLVLSEFPVGEAGLLIEISHVSGEWKRSTMFMPPLDKKPHGYGSVITYMRRYGTSAALMLETEEDDDGNAASMVPSTSQTNTQPPRRMPTQTNGGRN